MATLFSRKTAAVAFAVLTLSLVGGGVAAAQPTEADSRGSQPLARESTQPQMSPEAARAAQKAMTEVGTAATAISYAVVDADGTLDRGADVVAVNRYGVGQYDVIFNRDVSAGSYVATIGRADDCCIPPAGEISVAPRLATPNGVFVQTRDSFGNPADRGFYLHVVG